MPVQKLSSEDFGVLRKPGIESVQLVWARNAPDARVTMTRVTMDSGTAHALHSHPGAEQTWVVESGEATLLLADDETRPLRAGDVVRTPSGYAHGLRNEGPDAFVYLTVTTPPQDFTSVYGDTGTTSAR